GPRGQAVRVLAERHLVLVLGPEVRELEQVASWRELAARGGLQPLHGALDVPEELPRGVPALLRTRPEAEGRQPRLQAEVTLPPRKLSGTRCILLLVGKRSGEAVVFGGEERDVAPRVRVLDV